MMVTLVRVVLLLDGFVSRELAFEFDDPATKLTDFRDGLQLCASVCQLFFERV